MSRFIPLASGVYDAQPLGVAFLLSCCLKINGITEPSCMDEILSTMYEDRRGGRWGMIGSCSNTTKPLQDAFEDMFERYNVDVYFGARRH